MDVVILTFTKRRETLEGHETELDKLAGERATVKGSVTGETVGVESVVPSKKGKIARASRLAGKCVRVGLGDGVRGKGQRPFPYIA